ncbi:MAG: hypothetical protein FK734_13770 [Asgard group archaeon]|nr:hypothetical protein [Asgard group archaeon]
MQIQDHVVELETQKILIAGLDNAGKSSIQDIMQFISIEAAKRRIPSEEIELFQKKFLKKNYSFFIPPGQEELRLSELHGSMKNEYFENVSTLIFVIDSSQKNRFSEAQEELQRCIENILEFSPMCSNFIIYAHKQDLQEAVDALTIFDCILFPLKNLFPSVITKFKLFETTIVNPETVFEPFVKAIAKHVGTIKIDFNSIAADIREQVKAKIVLITDPNGLLVGESFTGEEDSIIYAAYVAKIFSATEDFQGELEAGGVETIILEEGRKNQYSVISRINCTKDDYLALFIGNPKVNLGMTRLVNQKGLEKLREAYRNYQN